jgi:hypothetical protein
LIVGDVKKNILNKPDERIVSTYNLVSTFNSSYAFKDSLILTQNDAIYLTQILKYPIEVKLLYRATKDGFQASSFHSKCDNLANTVTIVKTTSNSVFGGYTSAPWTINLYNDFNSYDENAFVFSINKLGNQIRQRFNISNPDKAVIYSSWQGASFGDDLMISDNSNLNENSYSNLGNSYQLPDNVYYGTKNAQSYLAGSYTWKTTEIEVYQITPFIPFSVTPLHNG